MITCESFCLYNLLPVPMPGFCHNANNVPHYTNIALCTMNEHTHVHTYMHAQVLTHTVTHQIHSYRHTSDSLTTYTCQYLWTTDSCHGDPWKDNLLDTELFFHAIKLRRTTAHTPWGAHGASGGSLPTRENGDCHGNYLSLCPYMWHHVLLCIVNT